jgi:hypothetical protein
MWRVVVGLVGLACLGTGGCGGSPDSASLVVVVLPQGGGVQHGVVWSNTVDVPDLTLVAIDGSRLVVVGTIDARCHPQGWEERMAWRP